MMSRVFFYGIKKFSISFSMQEVKNERSCDISSQRAEKGLIRMIHPISAAFYYIRSKVEGRGMKIYHGNFPFSFLRFCKTGR